MQNWNLTLHLQSTSLHGLSFSIEKRWEMNKYKVGKTSLTINTDLNFPRPMINKINNTVAIDICCLCERVDSRLGEMTDRCVKRPSEWKRWQAQGWKHKKKPLNWNIFSGHIFPTTICHKTFWERLHFLLLWSSLFFFQKRCLYRHVLCPNSPAVLKRSTNITYTNLIFKTIIILKRGDF